MFVELFEVQLVLIWSFLETSWSGRIVEYAFWMEDAGMGWNTVDIWNDWNNSGGTGSIHICVLAGWMNEVEFLFSLHWNSCRVWRSLQTLFMWMGYLEVLEECRMAPSLSSTFLKLINLRSNLFLIEELLELLSSHRMDWEWNWNSLNVFKLDNTMD